MHGFDEFFGIPYHLNAGGHVEQYDFPKDPEAAKRLAQRGVVHCWAKPDGEARMRAWTIVDMMADWNAVVPARQ
jgi:hypothetical protein